MTQYRDSYSEEDVQALTSSPRVLVAVDAFAANHCSLQQMTLLAFSEPPYIPRDLSLWAFTKLVMEVVRRVQAGELEIPEEYKRKYSHFYVDQAEPPTD
jgi:hypothetical protein